MIGGGAGLEPSQIGVSIVYVRLLSSGVRRPLHRSPTPSVLQNNLQVHVILHLTFGMYGIMRRKSRS